MLADLVADKRVELPFFTPIQGREFAGPWRGFEVGNVWDLRAWSRALAHSDGACRHRCACRRGQPAKLPICMIDQQCPPLIPQCLAHLRMLEHASRLASECVVNL